MFRRNKKGMELSINFIVMLIFAIVIFSFGIIFARSFFSQAQDRAGEITSQTKDTIRNLILQQNSQVAIYPDTMTIQRGESVVVGVGIVNTGDAASFKVIVDKNANCKLVDKTGTVQNCGNENTGVYPFYDTSTVSVAKNDEIYIPIKFMVKKDNSPSGKYIFTVKVKRTEGSITTDYGLGNYKVYVNVP